VACDIDQIIERLKAQIPGVHITQLRVAHPGPDDDGVWFIQTTDRPRVQIESSSGDCPFLIESDFTSEKFLEGSVEEVVSTVKRLCA
jgi:hypothetical protein